MEKKETKPIKAIDDSYKALTNKDRIIAFVKGFGSVALTFITLIACAGSLNYGTEEGRPWNIVAGAIGFGWCVYLVIKTFRGMWNRSA